jgi:hypothetical protein
MGKTIRPSALGDAGTELLASSLGATVVPAMTALVVFKKSRRSIALSLPFRYALVKERRTKFAPRILSALSPIFGDSSSHCKIALWRAKTSYGNKIAERAPSRVIHTLQEGKHC